MLQKLTMARVCDHSGAGWIQTIHLYRGTWRRSSSLADYIKGAVKRIAFYPRVVKGKRYRPLRVGYVVRGLIVQTRFQRRFVDNTRFVTTTNGVVLLKKRGVFKSKFLYGPLSRLTKKKQYLSLFDEFI